VALESRAAEVTLFEDRAQVVRKAWGTVPAGVHWVAVDGVTAFVDGESLVASVRQGRARVIASRVERRVREIPEASEEEVAAAEADRNAARRRHRAAEQALARVLGGQGRALALQERWSEALTRVPLGGREALARWRAAFESLDGALLRALDNARDLRVQVARAGLDLARAQLRLAQARATKPRYETIVQVQLEALEPGPVEVELRYRTPCALWRPEHVARLAPAVEGEPRRMILETLAAAWQVTGEEWAGVSCRFSTARPAADAAAPLLHDDLLEKRVKSDAERRTIRVQARDQAIARAELGRGERADEEMPGVDDGGEPLCFEASRPVTLPSDGRVFRVSIGQVTLPCQVELVAFPELTEVAHLRATATHMGPVPLLAGPVRLLRATELVGRGRVAFTAPGEPFEIGFGADDGLRIRREVEEKRETSALTGTQKIRRTVRIYVGNMGGAFRDLSVVERFPISEIEGVEVDIEDPGGASLDRRDGFARFALSLSPQGTREVSISYRIEAASRVQLEI
jgi:uncharacterized protein (TIGR02231 family)